MTEEIAFLNGRWIPASQVSVSVVDTGFVLGATVAEQLRTFGGRLFHLDDHLARLEDSLRAIDVAPPLTRPQMADAAIELAARNHKLVSPDDDLGLSIFVTPGTYPSYAPPGPIEPVVCMHTYRLPFRLWADKYTTGDALASTEIRQVPADCWPTGLKCRSRMHYYLADKQAGKLFPGARAVLLDHDDRVTEASTANVIVCRRDEGLLSPPLARILHGISLAVAFDLARQLGLPTGERELSLDDLASADEVFLSSTPLCLLPVTRLNGRPIGSGRPGEVFGRLIAAWSELVGLDIVAQAERFGR